MKRTKEKQPVPAGNPWVPSNTDPATVPVPLPVVIVNIEGPFTEKDRKLWAFLLHAVWDELDEEKRVIHELPVSRINQIFRELGGRHETNWIWESAKRLTKTTIEWEQTDGDERYAGIAALLSYALTHQQARQTGILRFEFPAGLIPIIKEPRRFARLRIHFMLSLSGKYAVSLYELLESIVNKINPVLEVQLDTLRQWLKVSEGRLLKYKDFRVRALEPAIAQINDNPLGAGFTVDMQPIKKGRAVHKIRFTVHKINERLQHEAALRSSELPNKGKGTRKKRSSTNDLESLPDSIHLSTTDYEKAKKVAPGWDIYVLEQQWREWIADKDRPDKPGPAFIAFCRQKHKRQGKP